MIFGTVFTGQIKSQNKQCIETKVFCIIIPLAVISTTLVTRILPNSRQGIEIKKNATSIIAAIIRPIITVMTFFAIASYLGNQGNSEWAWLLIPVLVFFTLFIYFWFFFGKTTKKERFIRNQFAKETSLYFMPNWLKKEKLEYFFTDLKKKHQQEFNDELWAEKLVDLSKYDPKFSLYFCLTALDAALNKNPSKEELIGEIANKQK